MAITRVRNTTKTTSVTAIPVIMSNTSTFIYLVDSLYYKCGNISILRRSGNAFMSSLNRQSAGIAGGAATAPCLLFEVQLTAKEKCSSGSNCMSGAGIFPSYSECGHTYIGKGKLCQQRNALTRDKGTGLIAAYPGHTMTGL